MLTKDINSKLRIDWREKAIHKVNKPPRYVESNCYWKQNDTAKQLTVRTYDNRISTNLKSKAEP